METAPRRLSFGAHADAYERARPAWPEEAAHWLVPEDAQLVVEPGAGTGKLTRAVAALGVRVVAVEPDPRMLAVLQRFGLEGVEGTAETIPFDDGMADAVLSGSSFHWFELEPALREFHRVLKPGGRVMLFEYTIPPRSALTPKESREIDEVIEGSAMASLSQFATGSMEELVGACGFYDVVVEDATDRIMPMLHTFARWASVPYWIATGLHLRRRFVNATAAVHWYRHRDIWRYVIVSATK